MSAPIVPTQVCCHNGDVTVGACASRVHEANRRGRSSAAAPRTYPSDRGPKHIAIGWPECTIMGSPATVRRVHATRMRATRTHGRAICWTRPARPETHFGAFCSLGVWCYDAAVAFLHRMVSQCHWADARRVHEATRRGRSSAAAPRTYPSNRRPKHIAAGWPECTIMGSPRPSDVFMQRGCAPHEWMDA